MGADIVFLAARCLLSADLGITESELNGEGNNHAYPAWLDCLVARFVSGMSHD